MMKCTGAPGTAERELCLQPAAAFVQAAAENGSPESEYHGFI